MVFLTFPNTLTEEEEMLKQKYAKLRKKRKQLQMLKTAKPEMQPKPSEPSTKIPVESAGEATEQAKKLVQSGAVKVGSGSKEKMGFKRHKHSKKKSMPYEPFSSSHGRDEEQSDSQPQKSRLKTLKDSFVPSGKYDGNSRRDRERDEHRDHDRDDRRSREPPAKGNTVYVHGVGITEEILKSAFSNFGNIININVEPEKNNGFVTFEKMESADQAISRMNGSLVSHVQLDVSMAWRQLTFENLQDTSSASTSWSSIGKEQDTSSASTSWSSMAANHSQKGPSRKDSRKPVSYEDDIF